MTTDPVNGSSNEPRRALVAEGRAVLACLVVGVLVSVWPHLLAWQRTGLPYWLADNDDLLYLSVAGRAMAEHPAWIGDPVPPSGGPTIYPWIQFAPFTLTARVLGLEPLAIGLVWRVWAGIGLAIASYLVLRLATGTPCVAAIVTIVLLVDCGFLDSRPLIQQARVAARVASGNSGYLLETKPLIHNQYRIITPGLSLVALALDLFLFRRPVFQPTRRRIVASGIGFGILYHVYFYYWTAAGLGRMIVMALDARHRRVAFHTAWIGTLIGAPALIHGAWVRREAAAGWPARFDMFLFVGRTSELLIHKEALLVLALTFAWVWTRQRDWLYLWALAASGWLLANQTLVTGLQILNEHWSYVRAPCLTWLLAIGLLAPAAAWMDRAARGRWILAVMVAGFGGIGLWLRTIEATQTRESVENLAVLRAYWTQRAAAGTLRLTPNTVLAGDHRFVDLAVIQENQRPLDHYAVVLSPAVSNAEWDERVALNGFLLGMDQAAFERSQRDWLAIQRWGPWATGRDPSARAERLSSRLAAYDRVVADPDAALDRFGVRALALPVGASPPRKHGRGWTLLQGGPHWDIWTR